MCMKLPYSCRKPLRVICVSVTVYFCVSLACHLRVSLIKRLSSAYKLRRNFCYGLKEIFIQRLPMLYLSGKSMTFGYSRALSNVQILMNNGDFGFQPMKSTVFLGMISHNFEKLLPHIELKFLKWLILLQHFVPGLKAT